MKRETGLIIPVIVLFLISCSKLELIEPFGFETNMVADSVVFAVIGDYGYAGDHEKEVSQLVKSWEPDFIVTTGDNNYTEGKFETIKQNISQYYADYIYNFDAPSEYCCNGRAFSDSVNRFFPTPGNHDANNKDGLVPYYNYFSLPGNESYYMFTWGPVTFYSLNSVDGDVNEQKVWLEQQVAHSVSPFNIVYFHHPPYSAGEHGNCELMQWDFNAMHVDAVFSGHDHIYNVIEKEGETGTLYIVNGLGGRERFGCDEEPVLLSGYTSSCYDNEFGAVRIVANNHTMEIEFIIVSPEEVIDRIVITK